MSESWVLSRAASEISEVMSPEDDVWALRNHLILWYLKQPPMSRVLPHPSNITRLSITEPLEEAGYIEKNELGRIINCYPSFIVTDNRGKPWYLEGHFPNYETYLQENYEVFFAERSVIVYRSLDKQNANESNQNRKAENCSNPLKP